jgi:hypothetical protein
MEDSYSLVIYNLRQCLYTCELKKHQWINNPTYENRVQQSLHWNIIEHMDRHLFIPPLFLFARSWTSGKLIKEQREVEAWVQVARSKIPGFTVTPGARYSVPADLTGHGAKARSHTSVLCKLASVG